VFSFEIYSRIVALPAAIYTNKLMFPAIIQRSCALDISDAGGLSAGSLFNSIAQSQFSYSASLRRKF
jgi:hypothetical protein